MSEKYVIVMQRDGDYWYYVGDRDEDGELLPENFRFSSYIRYAKLFDKASVADCAIVSKNPYKVMLLHHCPKCHQPYVGYPALSRDDDKTEICPACGVREALEAYSKYLGGHNG